VLVEELHVRRQRRLEAAEIPVTLKATSVSVQRTTKTITALFDSAADAERAREKLSELGLTEDELPVVHHRSR
jgi:hypothetical protein